MRILITGSRKWSDYWTLNDAILDACSWQDVWNFPDFKASDITIIHGNARGADTFAGEVGEKFEMTVEVYPARWDVYGNSAGPIRNQEMIDSGADICLAFLEPDSIGTVDCIKRARKAGIPVRVYHSDGRVEYEDKI